MFRIRASEVQAQIPKTATIVLVMLVLAFALSAAAVLQVYSEYRLLGEWQRRPGAVSSAEIGSLRRDIGSRIIVRSTASAILLLCTLTMVWLQQRQLAILRVLYQVKLLSLEILASMDQGVITTDLRNTITGINSAAVAILGVESECIGHAAVEHLLGRRLPGRAGRPGRRAQRGGLGPGFRHRSRRPGAADQGGCPRAQGLRRPGPSAASSCCAT